MARKSSNICSCFCFGAQNESPPTSPQAQAQSQAQAQAQVQAQAQAQSQAQGQLQPQAHPEEVSIDELKQILASSQIETEQLVSIFNFVKQAIRKLNPSSSSNSSSSSIECGLSSEAERCGTAFLNQLSTKSYTSPGIEHHKATLQVMSSVLATLGSLHWVFVGLSVLASTLNQTILISSNEEESIAILYKLETLASHLVDYHSQKFIPNTEILKRAIVAIIKGTIACCSVDHLSGYIGKLHRFLFSNANKDVLSDLRKEISSINEDLNNEYAIENLKRNPIVSSPNEPMNSDKAVGLKTKVEDVMKKIPTTQQQPCPCRALILYGIGGIGKTTLLDAVISKLRQSPPNHFKYAYVSLPIDQTLNQIKSSQEVLWQHIIGSKCKFDDAKDGRIKLGKELAKLSQPLLLAIDNALENVQVEELLPDELNKLSSESLIVVTTRDSTVGNELKRKGLHANNIKYYQVDKLSQDGSKELLMNTLDHNLKPHLEEDNLAALLTCCDGHPLALTIAAKFINDESVDATSVAESCKYVVESMRKSMGDKRIREDRLVETLEYSINVNKLPSDSRNAFLDIVLFYDQPWSNIKDWDVVQEVVGVQPFKKLCNRSLVQKDQDKRVRVHDLLRRLVETKMRETSEPLLRLGSRKELQKCIADGKLKQIYGLDLRQEKNKFLLQNLSNDNFKQMESLSVLLMPYDNHDSIEWQYKNIAENDSIEWQYENIAENDSIEWQYENIAENATLQVFTGSNLSHLPFTRTENLRLLDASDCPRLDLANLFSGKLKLVSLLFLRIEGCRSSSTTLPSELWNMLPSLKYLALGRCPTLQALPHEMKGIQTRLETLRLYNCKALKVLPDNLFCSLPSLRTLNLSFCESLEELPHNGMGALTSLETLDLSGCKALKALPDNLFCSLPSLRTLNLWKCESLEELPHNGMGALTSLETLHLSGCKALKALPDNLFCSLPSLRTLNLWKCESLEELPHNGMGALTSLETLDLWGCKALKALPDNLFCSLPSLRTLNLRECESLEELPHNGMGASTSLETLHLSGCKALKALPDNLFCSLPSLRTLSLWECESLEELPHNGMEALTSLETLDLSGCKALKALPDNLFCSLPSLRTLSLWECESLEELPHNGMEALTSLETLDLSGCKALKALPDNLFCSLPSLRTLSLWECESLEELPHNGMEALTSLETLDLWGCKALKALPDNLFCSLPSLRTLNLWKCESLEELPHNGMGALTSLETLHLSGCKALKALPDNLFCSLPSLRTLILRECESLEELPHNGVEALTSLQTLDLSGCKVLKALPEGLYSLTSLKQLNLSRCERLEQLPNKGMGALISLEELSLLGCKALKNVPNDFLRLRSLEELNIDECESLEESNKKECEDWLALKKSHIRDARR